MEKIKNNLKGKDYIGVVTDAIEANAEYYSFGDGEWMPKMIASGTLPILVRTPSLIDGRRKFDGGVADPLPVEKAYEMGAKKIIVIRTYEKKFRRKLKIENYIGALLSREYPKLRKALLVHDKTYNRALDFINNPPSDCEIVQLCPPALFTVGTRDLLLDDSLFMYGRWLSYGSNAEIIIVPGADHAFNAFPSETTTSVENKISEFVKSVL
jgi:predicted patatin/cPLA2 family phospholipase